MNLTAALPNSTGASPEESEPEECTIVEGDFAMLVQAFLAFGAAATLVYKRFREDPRRPWIVWFMDSSKQAFAMGLQHIANLVLAIAFTKTGSTSAGVCIWYIANLAIATVCGLFIVASYMRFQRWLVRKQGCSWLDSGNYGDDPKNPNWHIWVAQMLVWGAVCCIEKLLTAIVVIVPLHGVIDGIIAPMEKPLKRYPKAELVLVMIILPTLLTSLWSWAADSLIKKQVERKEEQRQKTESPTSSDAEGVGQQESVCSRTSEDSRCGLLS
mmetsp:Transcript_32655/g.75918  ORF Transcript_32655/g.75918 Transcript_32655/m.75918 type:complete len:270 (+) Transcript_32655:105-914(+)